MLKSPVKLALYDNSWYRPGGSFLKRTIWFFVGQPILRCSWMPFSGIRVVLLRLFGARIGKDVVIKPAVDVKYPWHLEIGSNCWIGERVWIDNLTTVRLGSNVCVSQGAYLCTGNHDWTDPAFGLIVAPIELADAAWVGARSILTPGTTLGIGAVAAAGAVVGGCVPDFHIVAGNPAQFIKQRIVQAEPKMSSAHSATTANAPSAGVRTKTSEVCS
jgi:putative colanic acid biosynthesis acetyltransferase WcaF